MDLNSLETLFRREHRARLFFVKSSWKNYRRFCIRCHGYKIYRIIGKRFRCKRCGDTFHDFSARWINNLRITSKLIWLAIVAHSRDTDELLAGEIELDEAYFGGRRKGKRGRGARPKRRSVSGQHSVQ